MFIIQCPMLWYAKVCALPSTRSSSICINLMHKTSSAHVQYQNKLLQPNRWHFTTPPSRCECMVVRCLTLSDNVSRCQGDPGRSPIHLRHPLFSLFAPPCVCSQLFTPRHSPSLHQMSSLRLPPQSHDCRTHRRTCWYYTVDGNILHLVVLLSGRQMEACWPPILVRSTWFGWLRLFQWNEQTNVHCGGWSCSRGTVAWSVPTLVWSTLPSSYDSSSIKRDGHLKFNNNLFTIAYWNRATSF